jgi:hypothetical protein
MPLRATFGALARAVALLCTCALFLAGGAAAFAAADPPVDPPTDPPVDSPAEHPVEHPVDHPDPAAYRALLVEVSRNTARIAEMGAEIDAASAQIAEYDVEITTTQQQLDAALAEIARLKVVVRARAAFIYTHAQAPQVILDIPHVEDIASGKQYAQSATISDASHIVDLTQTAASVDSHLQDAQAARALQVAQHDILQAMQSSLETVTLGQQQLLDNAGAITVMGDSELTGDQIAAWFNARGVHSQLSGDTTIGELADLFVEEGAAEHVRGDVAFAQALLETGSFAHATDNNYGGIGACDSCNGEIPFPTPRDGVRGQIQMLKNYADPTSRAANLANPPSPPIYGSDPVSAARAYDSFFAKGRVPTWNLMGNGNWATAAEYAPKVLGMYFEMVAFAARRA